MRAEHLGIIFSAYQRHQDPTEGRLSLRKGIGNVVHLDVQVRRGGIDLSGFCQANTSVDREGALSIGADVAREIAGDLLFERRNIDLAIYGGKADRSVHGSKLFLLLDLAPGHGEKGIFEGDLPGNPGQVEGASRSWCVGGDGASPIWREAIKRVGAVAVIDDVFDPQVSNGRADEVEVAYEQFGEGNRTGEFAELNQASLLIDQ